MTQRKKLSVVVPLFNEEGNVAPLVRAVEEALDTIEDWELILVDDGSTDRTSTLARELAETRPKLSLLRLARNYGQATALQAGFDRARGNVIVTMDGDLQNDPRDIPALMAKLEEGYDLVSGRRVDRQDTFLTRKIPSRVANRLIRFATGIPIRDFGCGIKAYRRRILPEIALYADMHRFIPAVAAAAGHARITEAPVRHHPRLRGRSKYGLSRIWKVLGDILAVMMIRWFRERPLVLFALAAAVALVATLAFGTAALFARGADGLGVSGAIVFPGAALLSFGLAVYLLMLGLIAEFAAYGTARGGPRPGGDEPLTDQP